MSKVVFCDTETVGLDPDRHGIWEVAAAELLVDPRAMDRAVMLGAVRRWFLPVDLSRADAIALDIGRFHERHPQGNKTEWIEPDAHGQVFYHGGVGTPLTGLLDFAHEFATLTHGAHLCGAVPSFDEERLRKLMLIQNVRPAWHYHLIDVEALAVGYIMGRSDADVVGLTLPWNSEDISRAVGVEPDDFEKHTAAGDVKWAAAIYFAVMSKAQEYGITARDIR